MSTWQGKSLGSQFGYKIFIITIKFLGLRPAYFLAGFVALYFWMFSAKPKRYIYYYFRRRHGFSRLKSIIYLYKNFYLYSQLLIDKVAVMAGFPNKFTFHFDGEEHLIGMADKGGILLSAHVGNWEVAGHYLTRLGVKPYILIYDEERHKIKEVLSDTIGKKNFEVIPIKNDLSHLYKLKEVLENGHIVVIQGDRFTPGANAMKCKFLGKEAEFPTGPLYLASKFKVPVSFVSSVKETRTHYHLFASAPKMFELPADPTLRREKMKTMLQYYVSELEKFLLKYPVQWFNFYDFWGINNKNEL